METSWKGKIGTRFKFLFSQPQQISSIKIYFGRKKPKLKFIRIRYNQDSQQSYSTYRIKKPSTGTDRILTLSNLPINSASEVIVQFRGKKRTVGRGKGGTVRVKEFQFLSNGNNDSGDPNDGNNGGSQSDLKWSYQTDPIYYGSPALGSNGTVYIGSHGGLEHDTGENASVYALSSSGSLLWKYTIGANKPVGGAIALDSNENLYFIVKEYPNGTNSSNITLYLYSLSPNGTLRWKTSALYSGQDSFGTRNPAIGSDDTIYAAAGYKLYAFNPDGTQKWSSPYEFTYNSQFSSCSPEASSPAVSGSTLFLNLWSTNCPLYGPIAITDSGSQGTLKWNETSSVGQNEPGYSSPAIDTVYGRVYLGRGAGSTGAASYLYAFDINDGSFVWKVSANGQQIHSTPSIGSDGTVYFGTTAKPANTTAGVFYAVNPDGTLKWSYDTTSDVDGPRDIYSSAAIGNDGKIYFSSEQRYIYAMNPNGTVAKKYDLYSIVPVSSGSSSVVHSSIAIASDGTLIVGDFYYKYDTSDPNSIIHQGAVYALRSSSSGLADTEWPRFRHDNSSSGRR